MGQPDAVAAEAEIRDLLARLAHLADAGTVAAYLRLFTPDAVWEMPGNPSVGLPADRRTGLADIEAGVRSRRAAGLQGPGAGTRHVVTTVAVAVGSAGAQPEPVLGVGEHPPISSADRATAVAYWMFFADTSTNPRLVSIGRYDDVLHRLGDRWLLHHRGITLG
jgi:hypothetical protein